jgi:hypothetical protein
MQTLLFFGGSSNDVDLVRLQAERRVDRDVLAAAVRAVDDDVVFLKIRLKLKSQYRVSISNPYEYNIDYNYYNI